MGNSSLSEARETAPRGPNAAGVRRCKEAPAGERGAEGAQRIQGVSPSEGGTVRGESCWRGHLGVSRISRSRAPRSAQ